MREEKVFIRRNDCEEYIETGTRHICKKSKEGIMKEIGQSRVQERNIIPHLSKQIEMAQNSNKLNCNNTGKEERETNKENNSARKISLPRVTITRPFNDLDSSETTKGSYLDRADKSEDAQNEDTRKGGGKIAGRRALPEITITCPPVEVFDCNEEDEKINELFTKRRYMVCRDSPRSGKRTISLVDFPHGLSALEKSDSLYLESPANCLDSPYSFSNVDLSFTYNSPMCSPFTPPFTPELRRNSKFIYPGPVPVFALEQSFPPAEFKDEMLAAD